MGATTLNSLSAMLKELYAPDLQWRGEWNTRWWRDTWSLHFADGLWRLMHRRLDTRTAKAIGKAIEVARGALRDVVACVPGKLFASAMAEVGEHLDKRPPGPMEKLAAKDHVFLRMLKKQDQPQPDVAFVHPATYAAMKMALGEDA